MNLSAGAASPKRVGYHTDSRKVLASSRHLSGVGTDASIPEWTSSIPLIANSGIEASVPIIRHGRSPPLDGYGLTSTYQDRNDDEISKHASRIGHKVRIVDSQKPGRVQFEFL